MRIKKDELTRIIKRVVNKTPIVDVHTHLFNTSFGDLLLWGIDELLTYHYLVAETMRYITIPYEEFWNMSKDKQAELIWRTLFVDRTPISEASRGVVTVLNLLGLDVSSKDLRYYRTFFKKYNVEEYIDLVFEKSRINYVIMTNDPFVEEERRIWLNGYREDQRFKPALRIDSMINEWDKTYKKLSEWGYKVNRNLDTGTLSEIKRFLSDWIERMKPVYIAASLPPTIRMPEKSDSSTIIEDAIIPIAEESNIPFAMMIGVKKLTNPGLLLAGDSVGKANIETIEYLCRTYPHNKFLVLMLSRENQHELVVTARKFRNLHIFGCWWFLNNPSIIDEITRERIEMLGFSFTPQHSDARVLDQLLYKWTHFKEIIINVLVDKYSDLLNDGWSLSEKDLERDVRFLFGGEFENFLKRKS